MSGTEADIGSTEEMRTQYEFEHTERLGAYFLFAAAAFMALGGIIKRVVGADIDAALSNGDMVGYLAVAADQQLLLFVNLSAWIIGVLFFGAAGAALGHRCVRRPLLARVAVLCYWTGVPLAIASFIAWLAIIVHLRPDVTATGLLVAEVLAWWVSRTDWIATVLLVGLGPLLISMAGRDEWVPSWLVWWGRVAAIAGGVNVLAMVTGELHTYGQLILPVGLGWTIAAGILLFRRAET